MCSLGIEPTTFCSADAMFYHWATQEQYNRNYIIYNIYAQYKMIMYKIASPNREA